jgi:putative endonuclease
VESGLAEHQCGLLGGYTARRRPVTLVFQESFERIEDGVTVERQIKGWRREKRKHSSAATYEALRALASRRLRP